MLFDCCVIKRGIRQGGILSPAVFNIHVDVLLQLTSSKEV